jgi:poly(3-hydroxybutyrate) depolymerase
MNAKITQGISELFKVDYYPIADLWGDIVRTLHRTGWLDMMEWNAFLQRSVVLEALPFADYPKPEFGIKNIQKGGKLRPVFEEVVRNDPFVELRKFSTLSKKAREPLLLVAPLSGHYATLLRETVATLVADFDVYITDWKNARDVHVCFGDFGLEEYVRVVRDYIELLGGNGDLHIVAVCQPTVPVFAAISLQAKVGGVMPKNTVLMGGPIDARHSPTKVNEFAQAHSLEWFADHAIHTVSHRYVGHGRKVYPGFLQLRGFMAVDPDRHVAANAKYHEYIISGDVERAQKHRRFYQEYFSVMDMPKEFFLDTISHVFHEQSLAQGVWRIDGRYVDPSHIKVGKLLTIEGELDNIVGLGQTAAAHGLAKNLHDSKKAHHVAKGVGHYGIFSGSTFREKVYKDVIRPFLVGD